MNKIPKWLFVVLLLAVVVLMGFVLMNRKGNEGGPDAKAGKPAGRAPLQVDAWVVKPSLLVDEITVTGSLMAYEEVDLKNEVAGRVVEMNLPEGRHVAQGTLLVKLYDDDLQAALKKLQVQLEIQQKIYERQTELLKVNGISRNDYEQSGLQINSLKADIEVQKVLIRKTEVRAPFDGVIGLRTISLGAQITPSTLLATIRREDRLKLDFSVPEKYSPEIHSGMKIHFTVGEAEKPYEASVMATEEGIDVQNRNLKVRAVVENPTNELLPGAFAHVNLRLGENPNALLIPTQSIIPEEDNKSVIVARKGKAHFVPVKTGIRRSSVIQVTGGLQPGDTVITNGLLFLKEGAPLLYSTVSRDTL
jgi:membrane fusion protein (multidrug efflux system)